MYGVDTYSLKYKIQPIQSSVALSTSVYVLLHCGLSEQPHLIVKILLAISVGDGVGIKISTAGFVWRRLAGFGVQYALSRGCYRLLLLLL